ncbi:coatomer subunit gamma, putative [Plasmodium reichenowi]|uniref:Gamma-coat protein n=1 Tax=Plasmodium reichenowi TaxID=5854 RepID=A0A2P9DH84_PLARE|nr:coatomer subunit gamma, putative [Plasmodium reichenowi]
MLKSMSIKNKLQKNLLKEYKNDDEKNFVNPHEGDKASILQETRVFSSYPLNTQKCLQILTKILYLINKGDDILTSQECTDIFFSITKLFQSNNERLRRMIYLLIKNLPVNEKEIFIVTSSLTKDMNSANDCYRANAIRVLSKIIDYSLATQIERYLKTAVVDRNPFVSSSALLCGLNLYNNTSSDIVKKWINEVSECINSKHPMIQFHALTLLCSIKNQDKLALEKIINTYTKNSHTLSSSLANCLLIKYSSYLIYCTEVHIEMNNSNNINVNNNNNNNNNNRNTFNHNIYYNKDTYSQHYPHNNNKNSNNTTISSTTSKHHLHNNNNTYNTNDHSVNKNKFIHPTTKVCFDYLKNCLKNNKDAIILFECIKCIFELAIYDQEGKNTTTVFNVDILNECIKVCQLFLLSSKIVDKFSIIRQINKLAHHRPYVVSKLNQDIENLLYDNNKSICVLAFTTLLKTGNETSIDKLLNQINNYMAADNTTFKIKIIEEVKNLCFIYPNKCNIILNFLSNNLRDDESYQFKASTIDSIILIITNLPNAEETAILQLCEFIEDCEYHALLLKVIRFLLIHIPKTKNPSKYIRYIYNRLLLENSTIRVDGMYALFYIALKCAENSKDILVLLNCLLEDNDDEVRDRTYFFYYMLKEKIKQLNNSNQQITNEYEQKFQNKQNINEHNNNNNNNNNIHYSNNNLIDKLLEYEPNTNIDQLLYFISNHIEKDPKAEFSYQHVKEQIIASNDLNNKDNVSSTIINKKNNKNSYNEIPNLSSTNSISNSNKYLEVTPDTIYINNMAKYIDIYNLSNIHIINKSIPLTESEAEYTVFLKKYIYHHHLVLEFTIHNTLSEQILSNVNVQMHSSENKWTILEKTTIGNLYYNTPQQLYVILKKNIPFEKTHTHNHNNNHTNDQNIDNLQNNHNLQNNVDSFAVNQNFQISLHFLVKENEHDEGFPDSYSINPFSIQIVDFINPKILRHGEFKHIWDSMQNYNAEVVSKFSLNFQNIQQAVVGLLNTLNMTACDQTDYVENNSNNHNILLSAQFLNDTYVLCKASLILSQQYGCLLKITCRSTNKFLSEHILKSLE